ncbi:nitroreductase [Roseibium aquae]|uniref:Putative NAD(P)H nitroreductase n=1 Tax=Roseibium aquae TaxID=1323746 RepID=A0A916TM86_9HYPH|nr:nitroreductase [Roseibium aquae]GGB59688.1 nitroreductase [Roseibium aquae]
MTDILPKRPEVLDFLSMRRSHAALTIGGPGPGEAELEALLTIAARVPDHGKLSPWRFIIYRDEAARTRIGERLAELAEASQGALEPERREQELSRFTRAPLVVGVVSRAAVHPKIPVWEQELSAGAVCMNLINAALASGFAAQWLSEWYCFDEAASRFLGCGEGERFAGFIHIGSPTRAPAERARPVLSDIVSHWREA